MKQIKIKCSFTKMVSVKELKTKIHPKNPNRHPSEQIVAFAAVLEKLGWRSAIVVSNLSGRITKGHGRLETAEYMHLKECPVEFQDYEDESEEVADMLADNKIQAMSELDLMACAELVRFQIMEDPCFDIFSTGFTPIEIDTFSFVAPVAPLQSGKPKQPQQSDEEDEEQPARRAKGKPSFKCPNCGFEDV